MAKLRIAKDFTLPIEAVTETFGILAKRGVGKTYTASVLIEEMLKAGLPVCVIDPIGVWWGLRAAADGISPGMAIAVLGGEHGDLPLTEDMGASVAQLVIEQRVPVVIDLSLFHKTQMVRFMTAFAEKLYHSNREALHLVLDEADMFAPQNVFKGGEKLLGAIENIVRRGRARGLGITLITQRPAVLNKNVLTQIEVLVALRTVAPQDRDAVDQWVKQNATAEQRADFMESLSSLPIGTAWFWSPGWLDIFQKVQVRQRETFDSSRTPKVGEVKTVPRTLADINLSGLQAQLADSLKEAAKTDPKLLQQRVNQLERALAEKPKATVERVEVSVISDDQLQRLESIAQEAIAKGEELLTFGREIMALIGKTQKPVSMPIRQPVALVPVPNKGIVSSRTNKLDAPDGFEALDGSGETLDLGFGPLKILQKLAAIYPIKVTKVQIGNLCDYTASGGTFGNYWGTLKRNGLVIEQNGEAAITQAGFDYLGIPPRDIPADSTELIAMWYSVLGAGERRLLETLLNAYPDAMSKEALGEATGYTASGGTFGNYWGTLRRNKLVRVDADGVRADGQTLLLGEMAVV